MADDIYVLDLWVTGADAVSVNDDGTGSDTILVQGIYAQTIAIDLAWSTQDGTPLNAGSRYVSADDRSHDLLIHGEIENAFGSNGTEVIIGNDVANILGGDQLHTGPGMADTIWGDAGNDRIYGGAGDDHLNGEADDDALWGDAGNDLLTAGSGRDTVEGGAGADSLDGGGDAGDMLSYAASRRGVSVVLQAAGVTSGHGGDAEGDQIAGFADVTGSALRDRIEVSDKAALADGRSDNQIFGGGGSDKIAVGGGDDHVFGGIGNDKVLGEAGDDSLSGEAGKDKLTGGSGQDALTGGSGADLFIFVSAADSPQDRPDVIADFSTLDGDCIDLRAMDADTGRVGNQAFHLTGAGFGGAAGGIVAELVGRDLYVSGDTDGDGLADFVIRLLNTDEIGAGGFLL